MAANGATGVKILGPNGRPFPAPPRNGHAQPSMGGRPSGGRSSVEGRYDAAITDRENRQHWGNVDHFSARAANNIQIRRILRDRSRYERANNSYLAGMVLTLANDTIGTGPHLQVDTEDDSLNDSIAGAWEEWAHCSGLAQKLHTMRQSRAVDGEAFALLVTNPTLDSPVQLDIKLLDAEQVSTPFPYPLNPHVDDGMIIDDQGNVLEWHLLKYHPGDMFFYGFPFQFDRIAPDHMVHWFRADRPWQFRGVPEVTPALPLFAQLRRYTLAVLAAAETAADFAAVLQSDMPPDTDGMSGEPFETLHIDKRMMTTLPAGWKMNQFKPEQPATTYEMFKREILNEIARCLNMPYNVAAGNSREYNYSSGRLDHQVYHKSIRVDRNHLERNVLYRLFVAWVAEARLAMPGLIPPDLQSIPCRWYWDGFGHVDPVKEATAQQIRLDTCTTTLAAECAREGQDWRAVQDQRARELARARQLGIPTVDQPGAVVVPNAAPQEPEE